MDDMKSMKLSKKNKDDYISEIDKEAPEYPWGLRIHLETSELEKLGIKDLPEVGSKHMIHAKVEVVDVHAHEHLGGDKSKGVGLQITDMGLYSEKEKPSAQEALYGDK